MTVRALCVLIVLAFLTFTHTASAQAEQRLNWVQPGDTAACLAATPSSAACSRVHWTFYLWPNFLRELERAIGPIWSEPDPDPWRNANPDPTPWRFAAVVGGALPNPLDPDSPQCPVCLEAIAGMGVLIQPGVDTQSGLTRQARLADLRAFRKALDQSIKALDQQIKQMEGKR